MATRANPLIILYAASGSVDTMVLVPQTDFCAVNFCRSNSGMYDMLTHICKVPIHTYTYININLDFDSFLTVWQIKQTPVSFSPYVINSE
jgi:hypothetical protein